MNRAVIALYPDLTTAHQALDKLVSSGFNRENISLVANDTTNEYSKYLNASGTTDMTGTTAVGTAATTERTYAATEDAVQGGQGASFGAVVGAVTGVVVGLAAFAIPGVGPVLGAGPLIAGLSGLTGGVIGAASGAITGGLTASLVKTGVPEEEAHYYTEGVRRGGTLVVVNTDDQTISQAEDILNSLHPVNIKEQAANWTNSGWKGLNDTTQPYTADEVRKFRQNQRVQTGDTPQSTSWRGSSTNGGSNGGYSASTNTDGTNTAQSIKAENIDSANHTANNPSLTVDNGNVSSNVRTNTATSLKADNIEGANYTAYNPGIPPINTASADENAAHDGFDAYNADFRSNFTTNYNNSGYTYDQYAPVYRYGYDLANDPRYSDQNWDTVQVEAQRDWEARNPGNPWENFKAAVRYAWDKVRGTAQ